MNGLNDDYVKSNCEAKDDDFLAISGNENFGSDYVDDLIDEMNEEIAALDDTDDKYQPIGETDTSEDEDTDLDYAIPDEDEDLENNGGIIWDDSDDDLADDEPI